MTNNKSLTLAIKEGERGMRQNHGGPFGAVIVRGQKIIARGHNLVLRTKDPTAHAEIVAIRLASKKLKRFDLSDCVIYSSCEPCPMCLAAIHWAKMKKLYYAGTRNDAAKIYFDDKFIYDVIKGKVKGGQVKVKQIKKLRKNCLEIFQAWQEKEDKVRY